MKVITKVLEPLNHFWVEDYNEAVYGELLDVGFVEVKYGGFKPRFCMELKGSGTFGFWNKEEKETAFTILEKLKVNNWSEWDGFVTEQNPYD